MRIRVTVAFGMEEFEKTGIKKLCHASIQIIDGKKYKSSCSYFQKNGRNGAKNESGAKKFLKILKGEHELETNFRNVYKTNEEAISALEEYLK